MTHGTAHANAAHSVGMNDDQDETIEYLDDDALDTDEDEDGDLDDEDEDDGDLDQEDDDRWSTYLANCHKRGLVRAPYTVWFHARQPLPIIGTEPPKETTT